MHLTDLKNYTPLYRALNEDRYIRRDFLTRIKEIFKVDYVISYVSPSGQIDALDPVAFEDVLYHIDKKVNGLLLILHSNGGDPNQAEKLVEIIRDRARRFYVVIPERAKSSATLLSLGSDKIYMLESSELGPIDPQIKVNTPQGEDWKPAHSIIEAFEYIYDLAKKERNPSPALLLLIQSMDLTQVMFAQQAMQHAQAIAEKLLENYMLKGNKKDAHRIANTLADAKQFLSHGRPIRWKDARSMGLKVQLVKRRTDHYEVVWRYFTHSLKVFRKGVNKLIESSSGASLLF